MRLRIGIRHPEELSLCRPADADDLRANSDFWLQTIRKQIFAEMNPDAPPPEPAGQHKRSGAAPKASTANGGGSRKDLSSTSNSNLLAATQPSPRAPELYSSTAIIDVDRQQGDPQAIIGQKSPQDTLARGSSTAGLAAPAYATLTISRTSLAGGGTMSRSQSSVYAGGGMGTLTLGRSGNLAIIDELATPNASGTFGDSSAAAVTSTLPPVSWRQLHELSAAPIRTRNAQQRARLNAGYVLPSPQHTSTTRSPYVNYIYC